jgi:hypothetical protein
MQIGANDVVDSACGLVVGMLQSADGSSVMDLMQHLRFLAQDGLKAEVDPERLEDLIEALMAAGLSGALT